MYCAFLRLRKGIRYIFRVVLWFKLIDSGVSCKMVNMIMSLYSKVLAAVIIQTDVSCFFEISLGAK